MAVTLLASLAGAGCSDQVVGYFGEGSDTTATIPEPTTSGAADSSSGEPGGPEPFVAPGCFADDFDDDQVDGDLWNTWAELDSVVEETSGQLKFTPPTTGVHDTGIVGNYLHVFDHEAGHARIQVTIPPDPARPNGLFLMLLDDQRSFAINLSGGGVAAWLREGEVPVFSEEIPMQPYPGWIGIRTDGAQVHFEVSDDGVTWNVVATTPQPWTLVDASALVMSQTYGDDPSPPTMAVDNIEVCVQ